MSTRKLSPFLFVLALTVISCQKDNHPKEPTPPIDSCQQNNCCEANFGFQDGSLDFNLKPSAIEMMKSSFGELDDPDANDDCGTESSFFMDYIVENGIFICNATTCPCGSTTISLGQSCYFPIKHFKPEVNTYPCTGASGRCLRNHYEQETIRANRIAAEKQRLKDNAIREASAIRTATQCGNDCPLPAIPEPSMPRIATLTEIPLCVGNHCQCGHKETLDGKCLENGYPICGTQLSIEIEPSFYLDFGPENIEDYICEPVDYRNKYTPVKRREETTRDIKPTAMTMPDGGHADGAIVTIHPKGELLFKANPPTSVWTCNKDTCVCGDSQIRKWESCLSVRTNVYGECPDGAIPDRIDGKCITDFRIDRYPGCGYTISTFDTSDYVCKNGEWVCENDSCACGQQTIDQYETCACKQADPRTYQCIRTDEDSDIFHDCTKDPSCKGSAFGAMEKCNYSMEEYTRLFNEFITNPKEYKEIDGQKVCQNKTCSCGNLTLTKGQACTYYGYTGKLKDYNHECDAPRACLIDYTYHKNPYIPRSGFKKSDYYQDKIKLTTLIYCDQDSKLIYNNKIEQNNTPIHIEDIEDTLSDLNGRTNAIELGNYSYQTRSISEDVPIWRCDKINGCACGSDTCEYYGICTQKGCVYDNATDTNIFNTTEKEEYSDAICGFDPWSVFDAINYQGDDYEIIRNHPWIKSNNLMSISKSGMCTCGVSTFFPNNIYENDNYDEDEDSDEFSVTAVRSYSCATRNAESIIQSFKELDPNDEDDSSLMPKDPMFFDKLDYCLSHSDPVFNSSTLTVSGYQCLDPGGIDGPCKCGNSKCHYMDYCVTSSTYTKSPKCMNPYEFWLLFLEKTYNQYCKNIKFDS